MIFLYIDMSKNGTTNFWTKRIFLCFYSDVYLYQRKEDRKEIIIKQITMDGLNTEQRKGVINEINLSAMFDHPNIIKYMEYFLEGNTFMIVMEYAAGT